MRKDSALDVFAYVLGFKPAKTVVHRLLIISLHILGWGLFLTLPLLIYRIEILDTFFLYREVINKVFLILLFYFHYYFLIPRFFQKKQYGKYFLTILGCLLVICLQQLVVESFIQYKFRKQAGMVIRTGPNRFFHRLSPVGKMQLAPMVGSVTVNRDTTVIRRVGPDGSFVENIEYRKSTDQEKDTVVVLTTRTVPAGDQSRERFVERSFSLGIPAMPMGRTLAIAGDMPVMKLFGSEIPLMALPMLLMDTLTSAVIILLISGFIKLANSLLISEKQKKVLETERLNAELSFLKLQINPHFLFNTLNSIYSQAHLKSEQTEYSILKFSQIMRYVLYDTSTEKITLRKDLEYISNYIDLQKLRLSKNVTVRYNVTGHTDNLLIAPLLLITYIENAFKHGVSYTIPSEIRINIDVIGNSLLLTVSNAITSSRQTGYEGVGLINAKRRLDVLYPGRYLLDVVDNKSLYIVNLKIELDHEN
ncbi:sensor histidine kinase [Pseudoflavitalea rhizosphaerae]|uniref:sensor histidine kinase n=1 Tax=Pseudoflavitalea rhizosphaerae TaxID=1884793 RepID=UPI000F8E0817|nr:sensor histidine kinase [Pseudoflavitalea rhizosphaerae]